MTQEELRQQFVTQMQTVANTMKQKQEELGRLEVQLEQLRGAVYAMDRAIEESKKPPLVAVPVSSVDPVTSEVMDGLDPVETPTEPEAVETTAEVKE